MAERDLRDRNPAGDWVADGGSDGRKDAGEDGGAMKGTTIAVEVVWLSMAETAAPGTTGSGTRTA